MKRIIDMLMKMVYPMLGCLFIACFSEAFNNLYSDDGFDYLAYPLYALAVIFGVMFLIGIILNIVSEILHLEDKKPETQKQKTILFIIKITACALVWAVALGHCIWLGAEDYSMKVRVTVIVYSALLLAATCIAVALIVAYVKDRKSGEQK